MLILDQYSGTLTYKSALLILESINTRIITTFKVHYGLRAKELFVEIIKLFFFYHGQFWQMSNVRCTGDAMPTYDVKFGIEV